MKIDSREVEARYRAITEEEFGLVHPDELTAETRSIYERERQRRGVPGSATPQAAQGEESAAKGEEIIEIKFGHLSHTSDHETDGLRQTWSENYLVRQLLFHRPATGRQIVKSPCPVCGREIGFRVSSNSDISRRKVYDAMIALPCIILSAWIFGSVRDWQIGCIPGAVAAFFLWQASLKEATLSIAIAEASEKADVARHSRIIHKILGSVIRRA